MPKYEINIGVSGKNKGGGGVSAELRQQVQQAKKFSRNQEKTSSSSIGVNKKLISSIDKLIQSNIALAKSIQSQSRGGVGGGTGGGGGGGGGAASGFGRLGSSVPFVGAVLGALAIGMRQIMKIGKAHLARASEQLQTAGIADTQTYGRESYFTMAQQGQYIKSIRMQSGTFGKYYDTRERKYKATEREIKAGLAPSYGGKMSREDRADLENKRKQDQLTSGREQTKVIKYAKRFGLGPQEIGNQLGAMNVVTRGAGAAEMRKTYGILQKRGVETEIPTVMKEISSVMEEAVKNGVSDSSMASDMAREIGVMTRYSPNLSARSAMQVQRGLMSTQNAAAKGQFESLPNWRMFQLGRGRVRNMMAGKGGQETLQSFVQQGFVNKEQIAAYRKSGGASMSPEMERFLTQAYLAKNPKAVRQDYMKEIAGKFGGNKGSVQERMYKAFTISQSYGLSPGAETAQQFSTLFKTGEAARTGVAPKYINAVQAERGARMIENVKKGGAVFSARGRENVLQGMQMNEIASKASQTVILLERSMASMANSMNGTVSTVIGGLNAGIKSLANGVKSVISEIDKFRNKGLGGMIKSAIGF